MAYDKLKTENYAIFQGINTKSSPYINGPQECLSIENMDFMQPGSLTKRWGSTAYISATVSGRIASGIEFQKLDGQSYIIVNANTNLYYVTNSYNTITTGLLNNGLFDFVPFVDRVFAANGQDFLKIAGQTAAFYGVPQPPMPTGFSSVDSVAAGLVPGTYLFSYAYVDDIGQVGQASSQIAISLGNTTATVYLTGITSIAGYGVTSFVSYRTASQPGDLTSLQFATTILDSPTVLRIPVVLDPGPQIANDAPRLTLVPKYLEIYNNQLFMAGFSQALSTIYWSEIGQPELVQPESFAEVRTNDGDRITGLQSSFQSLFITKERSFHRLSGDDPSNFLLAEISDQYGCISNRAMVTYESRLWFLDTKGIVEYDGANPRIISNPVEPIFTRMNVAAARENAVGLHHRVKNQVEFYIPIDGATMNNCVVVYDYLTSGWTTYRGLNISSVWLARGALNERSVMFGGYTGNIFYFDKRLYGDNGADINCEVKGPFVSPIGQTTEKQFRRLWSNINVVGTSHAISVNMYANYGATTVVATREFNQGATFQDRIDFGVPARSMSFEWTHTSASLPFRLDGYGVAYRFQRDV